MEVFRNQNDLNFESRLYNVFSEHTCIEIDPNVCVQSRSTSLSYSSHVCKSFLCYFFFAELNTQVSYNR